MSLQSNLGLDNNLVMKYKQLFIILKMRFKIRLKIIYFVQNKVKIIFVEWGWTKTIARHESYGKTDKKNEHNIREYDIYC